LIGEIELGGVFLPVILIVGAAAFVVTLLLRRIFRAIKLYGFVWHAGLFDVALFVVVWWLIAYCAGTQYGT